MTFQNLVRGGACVLLSGALAACGGGGSGDPKFDSVVPPVTAPPVPVKTAPVITAQPQSQPVLTGGSATFTFASTGSDLSYQWSRDGTAISGATSSSYTVSDAAYTDNGAKFSVVVTNAQGSATSLAAPLNLILSADQLAFESLNVAPGTGSVELRWNLAPTGGEVSGTHYAYSETATTIISPLTNGPQTNAETTPQNLSTTLALKLNPPTRMLKAGAIVLVPQTLSARRISYVGSAVQVDSFASDGTTVALSETRSNFSSVALSGTIGSTPLEMAHWYNSLFANTGLLNSTAAYASGSAYIRYDAVNKGDRYTAFDCHTTTTDANISACSTATTLQVALTTGITSNSDGTTYHLADGTVSTAEGVSVWVATAPRPISATQSSAPEYRIYFQLNGNVYTGSLIKDGVKLGGSYWVSTPLGVTVQDQITTLDYQIRLNKAARDSIAAAALF
ncbi:MAG TPA: immunoglobulin domain-containing protein [Burkholderiaceae bacterium]|jgi:hypothetical protein